MSYCEGVEIVLFHCENMLSVSFSELALITNKPRAASAYAVGEVTCAGKDYHWCLCKKGGGGGGGEVAKYRHFCLCEGNVASISLCTYFLSSA